VRVRLAHLHSSRVEISGLYLRYPGSLAHALDGGLQKISIEGKRLIAHGHNSEPIEWLVRDALSNELISRISQSDAHGFSLRGENLRMNLQPAPGEIELFADGHRGLDLIATLDLDTYVRGVLPNEMPADWPIEALKAQAIAVRSYALYRAEHRAAKSRYDVESSIMDQVFIYESSEVKQASVERAVSETRGQILVDRSGRVLPAYFHADCGGRTEEARHVWGESARLGTAIDGSCPLNPRAKWSLSVTDAQLAQAFGRGDKAVAIKILTTTPSGRNDRIQIAWLDGTHTDVRGNEFRKLLGFDRLRSNLFHVDTAAFGESLAFQFHGQGFGHGVGLCQWGTRQMASHGSSAVEALKHYYPRAFLTGASLVARQVEVAKIRN
jgi:stage II sporulation protein D